MMFSVNLFGTTLVSLAMPNQTVKLFLWSYYPPWYILDVTTIGGTTGQWFLKGCRLEGEAPAEPSPVRRNHGRLGGSLALQHKLAPMSF